MNFKFDPQGKRFQFMKHRWKYFIVSGTLIVAGFLCLALLGLNLSIDFESGSSLEILIHDHSFTIEEVEAIFTELGMEPGDIRLIGNNNEVAEARFVGTLSKAEIDQVQEAFSDRFGQVEISETTVSPMVAQELARKAIYGILWASLGVSLYVVIRFEYRFGVTVIVALLHDVLLTVALFSILRLEVDLTFIAAILTIVGYSINNTIVIFDRLRENMKRIKAKSAGDLEQLVNRSIVETLPRSINTSVTVLFAALALYVLGGEGIRNFSFALLIGLTIGTYSSIFISPPMWFEWKRREMERKLFHS